MSLHADLLEQSQYLVRREPKKPKQASLRRSVSSAYYAIFHLLIHHATLRITSDPALRQMVGRAFIHGEMAKASKSFAGGNLSQKLAAILGGKGIAKELRDVAQAFIDLQQARHEADYNLAKSFSRSESQALVDQASQAFRDWSVIRKSPEAELYLLCLLLNDRWEKVK